MALRALSVALLTLLASPFLGERVLADEPPLSAEDVRERWEAVLNGRHFTANVTLAMRFAGHEEHRRMRVYRDDTPAAGERVMIRFEAPPDLRNLRFLYVEQPDRSNEYYLYQADLKRMRRIHESIADDDLYGIDLEFLGFGGVPPVPVDGLSIRRETLGDREVYVLHERAREPNARFEERRLWIDRSTFVALRTEHLVEGGRRLLAETLATRTHAGVEFPTRIRFERDGGTRSVELTLDDLDLVTPLPDDVFTILALSRRRAP
jgi:hypothetical protein